VASALPFHKANSAGEPSRKGVRLASGCGATQNGSGTMCDYSLHNVRSRPAKVGDKLTARDFGTGTRGFAAAEDATVAVCVQPGTELSFAAEVRCTSFNMFGWNKGRTSTHRTAIFRQVNKDRVATHHDALEFPDGEIVLLTHLSDGQQATVLQLPADPKAADQTATAQRPAYVG
jgi:hypothetical protein